MSVAQKYNGWKNYETWNVALWIGNDEFLYNLARRRTYKQFLEIIETADGEIRFQTPDGVAWNDSGLDLSALNEMLGDL